MDVKVHTGFMGGVNVQVAVAIVRKLGTRFGRPMNVEAAYFADSLYNAWQMEHKDCRNGVLLVASLEDREVRSSTRDLQYISKLHTTSSKSQGAKYYQLLNAQAICKDQIFVAACADTDFHP